jgi:hypothetical protein
VLMLCIGSAQTLAHWVSFMLRLSRWQATLCRAQQNRRKAVQRYYSCWNCLLCGYQSLGFSSRANQNGWRLW